MQRILVPELLDSLAPEHPDALHNRRDLKLINRIMGNPRWFAHTLPPFLREGECALELGAGIGELGARLAAKGIATDGLDLWPRPPTWPAAREWHMADLRTFDGYARYPLIFGNLIFHQFDENDLSVVGQVLRRNARVIVACEPARRRVFQTLFAGFGLAIGANHVTRHDGHVSIASGFVGDELPRALGLSSSEWEWRCDTTLLGAYRMIARRRA